MLQRCSDPQLASIPMEGTRANKFTPNWQIGEGLVLVLALNTTAAIRRQA
jgi:hypothetical protein